MNGPDGFAEGLSPGPGGGRTGAAMPGAARTAGTVAALERPRLTDRLVQRFDVRLLVLQAGPGFGKSTAIRQALARNLAEPRGLDVVIECSADDVHLVEFSDRFAVLLGIEGVRSSDPVTAATAIADAISLRSPVDVCIVIEDAHLVTASPSWDLIRTLHERLPPNGHLVISTRTDPSLPFARLAARGEAILIDEEELSFTPAESAAFGTARGVDLTVRPIAWPALAELEVLGAGPRLRRSYLVEEVVGMLTQEVRELLGVVVIAEGADDSLASLLVGRSVQVGEQLRSVPLVRVDDDGWVQPHDLWRHALPDLLSADGQRRAQDVAATELARRGRYPQAVRLHSASGNWAAAGRVALSALTIQPPAVDTSLLADLLDHVPPGDRAHPGWQLAAALVTYERSLPAAKTALERLADALEQLDTGVDDAVLGEAERTDALVTTMFHLGTIGRRMADESVLAGVVERLSGAAERRHARALAVRACVAAFLAQIHGRCAEGLEALRDVDHGSISPEQSAHVLLMAGNLHLLDARPERAAALYREASAKAHAVRILSDELHTTTLWVSGATDDAIDAERRCLELAERLGLTSRAAQFRAMTSAMLAMRGRYDEARDTLDALPVELGSRSADGETRSLALLTLALLALAEGDRERAVAMLRRIPEPAGNLQRAMFFPVASIVALVPERTAAWAAIPARLIRQAVAAGLAARPSDMRADHTTVPVDRCIESSDARTRAALVPEALSVQVARGGEEDPAPPKLRLSLLGPVMIEPLADPAPWRRARVRELAAAIALSGLRTREQVAELLWPDQPDGVAARNLRVNLSYLADAVELERTRQGAVSLLRVDRSLLSIAPEGVWVDLVAFDDCRRRARASEHHNDPTGALAALTEAVGLWRGDVAADIEADWLDEIRRQRRAQFIDMAGRAGELALGQGEIDQALAFAARVVELEPTHEGALRLRAACLLADGDRASAVVAMRICLQRCEEDGVEPEPETLVLATRLGVM